MNLPTQTILLPIDFSSRSLTWATRAATTEYAGEAVCFVHVLAPLPPVNPVLSLTTN